MARLRSVVAMGSVLLVAGLAWPLQAAERVVEIRDYQFQPANLRIKTGDTVRWVNREKRTSHSILFRDPAFPESDRLFPDESWTRRFDQSGTHVYTCGPHPEMKGTIEVEP